MSGLSQELKQQSQRWGPGLDRQHSGARDEVHVDEKEPRPQKWRRCRPSSRGLSAPVCPYLPAPGPWPPSRALQSRPAQRQSSKSMLFPLPFPGQEYPSRPPPAGVSGPPSSVPTAPEQWLPAGLNSLGWISDRTRERGSFQHQRKSPAP